MPTAPVAYEAAPRRRSSYEQVVRKTLKKLGSPDPEEDVKATGDLLVNSQKSGMDPKAAAGIIYATARHRHPPTSVLAQTPPEERRLMRELFEKVYPAVSEAQTPVAAASATAAEEQPCTKVTRDGVDNDCKQVSIHSDKDLYRLLAPSMKKETQETFRVVCLDVHGDLVGDTEVARGQVSKVAVDVEDVMQAVLAVKPRPTAFFVAHVHPSGKAMPSDADKKLTEAIRQASKVALPGTVFADHMIVGGGNSNEYYSFADKKLHHASG